MCNCQVLQCLTGTQVTRTEEPDTGKGQFAHPDLDLLSQTDPFLSSSFSNGDLASYLVVLGWFPYECLEMPTKLCPSKYSQEPPLVWGLRARSMEDRVLSGSDVLPPAGISQNYLPALYIGKLWWGYIFKWPWAYWAEKGLIGFKSLSRTTSSKKHLCRFSGTLSCRGRGDKCTAFGWRVGNMCHTTSIGGVTFSRPVFK